MESLLMSDPMHQESQYQRASHNVRATHPYQIVFVPQGTGRLIYIAWYIAVCFQSMAVRPPVLPCTYYISHT